MEGNPNMVVGGLVGSDGWRNPVGVGWMLGLVTQGSACLATPGWRTQPRWDSGRGDKSSRQRLRYWRKWQMALK